MRELRMFGARAVARGKGGGGREKHIFFCCATERENTGEHTAQAFERSGSRGRILFTSFARGHRHIWYKT